MVEIDGKEQRRLLSLRQQAFGFLEVEDERLLDEEWKAGLDGLNGRLEMVLVGQAQRDEIRVLLLQHLMEVEVGRRAELGRACFCLIFRCGPTTATNSVSCVG